MPHQCTNCGKVFGDGSKEMLSGCPGCGNNKFQFRPAGTLSGEESAQSPADGPSDSAADTAGEAKRGSDSTTGADGPRRSPGEWPDPDGAAERLGVAGSDRDGDRTPEEKAGDRQSGPDDADSPPDTDRTAELESDERPGLSDLRKELNDQFESIKVLNPGQYELNLMELYDREEYIISLQEDGRYVIEVPDAWSYDEDS